MLLVPSIGWLSVMSIRFGGSSPQKIFSVTFSDNTARERSSAIGCARAGSEALGLSAGISGNRNIASRTARGTNRFITFSGTASVGITSRGINANELSISSKVSAMFRFPPCLYPFEARSMSFCICVR